jgi:hypothetical protein
MENRTSPGYPPLNFPIDMENPPFVEPFAFHIYIYDPEDIHLKWLGITQGFNMSSRTTNKRVTNKDLSSNSKKVFTA